MTLFQLLRRNLVFHRRGNLAVLLGVAVGTAVLTGALLVGDSLRGSLRERALDRLWWVDEALLGGRFARQKLADEVGQFLHLGDNRRIEAGIVVRGTVEIMGENGTGGRRVGNVTVLAMEHDWSSMHYLSRGDEPPFAADAGFWHVFPQYRPRPARTPIFVKWDEGPGKAYISAQLAHALGLDGASSGRLQLRIQKPSAIPRESLLGRRGGDSTWETIELTVAGILST